MDDCLVGYTNIVATANMLLQLVFMDSVISRKYLDIIVLSNKFVPDLANRSPSNPKENSGFGN